MENLDNRLEQLKALKADLVGSMAGATPAVKVQLSREISDLTEQISALEGDRPGSSVGLNPLHVLAVARWCRPASRVDPKLRQQARARLLEVMDEESVNLIDGERWDA